jgi:hypothetical protein
MWAVNLFFGRKLGCEIALIRRFAPQLRYSFQSIFEPLSIEIRRPRAWAAEFLERLDKAKAAAAARSEDNNN